MSKFLFCTDQHIHIFNDFAKPDKEFGTDRLREQIEALDKVFSIARKHEATVVFGGDLFHKRGSVRVEVFNRVFEVMARNSDIEVYILRGNHDSINNNLDSESSITPLGVLPNVHVQDQLSARAIKDTYFVFVPYGDETEDMKQFIQDRSVDVEQNKKVLVAHIGVDGASQGRHSHRLSGAFGYGDLNPEYFDFILLGHYHKRQIIGDDPNHFYGGSYMQHNFGDEGQEKGVHIIDTDTTTTEFISLDTTNFLTIKGSSVPENLDEVMEKSYVRFLGNTQELKMIERMQEQGVDIGGMRVELQRNYDQEARLGLDASMSESDIVKAYAKDKYPRAVHSALECLSLAQS